MGSLMLTIEMYITIKNPVEEKTELAQHPLLALPYIRWGKNCDCLGHVHVTMEDQYEYDFRDLCCNYDIKIVGDYRFR